MLRHLLNLGAALESDDDDTFGDVSADAVDHAAEGEPAPDGGAPGQSFERLFDELDATTEFTWDPESRPETPVLTPASTPQPIRPKRPAAAVAAEKSHAELHGNVTNFQTWTGFSLLRAGVDEERAQLSDSDDNDDSGDGFSAVPGSGPRDSFSFSLSADEDL